MQTTAKHPCKLTRAFGVSRKSRERLRRAYRVLLDA